MQEVRAVGDLDMRHVLAALLELHLVSEGTPHGFIYSVLPCHKQNHSAQELRPRIRCLQTVRSLQDLFNTLRPMWCLGAGEGGT